MSADQRGEVLGEEQLKGPVKSVFDYMSAKSRERLAQIIPADRQPGASVGVSVEEEKPRIDEPQEGVIVPPLSPRTASAALKGFIPFGDDPGKQLRYTSYLRSQVVNTTEPNPKLFPSGKLDQVNKELSDFMKSAQMFRPMSFAMANRFTSSKLSTQDMAQPKPGLHVPDPTKVDEWKDKAKLEQEVKEVLTPREEAARAGLWGKMTRVTADWAPNALVCKRFGVANPWPDGLPGTASETKQPEGSAPSVGRALGTKPLLSAPGDDVAWQNNFVHQAKPEESKPELEDGDAIPKDRKPRTIAEVGMAEDENQGRDTLTYKKPELDIFKAIFASDDEDDSEDEDEEPVRATPLHLDLQNPTPMTVEPSNEAKPTAEGTTLPPVVNIPVAEDVARPIFGLANSKNKTEGDSKRASKKDKKRDRVKAKTMLSFDVGEDGDEDLVVEDKRDKKRRKKVEPDTKVEAVPIKIDEDDEWVEAPPVL
jgi:G patch domain-containing protein 1